MKTTITIEIDEEDLTITEENCPGFYFKISNDLPSMAYEVAEHLTEYLLDEH